MSHATPKKIVAFRIQEIQVGVAESFRCASPSMQRMEVEISRWHYVSYTRAYRGGCATHDRLRTYVRRAAKSLLARQTTGNVAITMRICAGAAACARELPRTRARHTDATQISSAITQNANRARKRGPPFCPLLQPRSPVRSFVSL